MRDFEDCYPFVQHMRVEHAHVRGALHRVYDLLHTPAAKASPDQVRAQAAGELNKLHQELVHHMAEEDAGGCLEEAVCRCPQLSGQADEVRGEHPRLLAELERLIALARRPAAECATSDLVTRFCEFSKRMHQHQTRENDVLAHGLAISLEDNGG